MTYPPSPVSQPTFVAITCAGLLTLLAAAVLALVQPAEVSQAALQGTDVSTTGSIVQTRREWTDPVRITDAQDVLLTTSSD